MNRRTALKTSMMGVIPMIFGIEKAIPQTTVQVETVLVPANLNTFLTLHDKWNKIINYTDKEIGSMEEYDNYAKMACMEELEKSELECRAVLSHFGVESLFFNGSRDNPDLTPEQRHIYHSVLDCIKYVIPNIRKRHSQRTGDYPEWMNLSYGFFHKDDEAYLKITNDLSHNTYDYQLTHNPNSIFQSSLHYSPHPYYEEAIKEMQNELCTFI